MFAKWYVAPNGVLYVNTWSGRYYQYDKPPAGGFLVALKDNTGDGRADVIERFGPACRRAPPGGTGIYFYNGGLYAEQNDKIVRYPLEGNAIVPAEAPQVIVSGLPLTGDHPMHPFIIDARRPSLCRPRPRDQFLSDRKPHTEFDRPSALQRA